MEDSQSSFAHAGWMLGQSQRACTKSSVWAEQNSHIGSWTTVRFHNLSFDGRESLRALHANIWIFRGTWSDQTSCHTWFIWLGFELLGRFLSSSSNKNLYPLLTEYTPDFVPRQKRTSLVTRLLRGILLIAAASYGWNNWSIRISSHHRTFGRNNWETVLSASTAGPWNTIFWWWSSRSHLSLQILMVLPSPTL